MLYKTADCKYTQLFFLLFYSFIIYLFYIFMSVFFYICYTFMSVPLSQIVYVNFEDERLLEMPSG